MTTNRRAFLKQLGFGTAGLGLVSFVPGCQTGGLLAESSWLLRSSPEAEGVSSAGVLAFLEAVGKSQHELHSIMVVRHGRVVAEGWWSPYGPELRHTLYSLSKSFTSTAVGLAVAEGKLRVEDPVALFFPEDLPEKMSENLAAMRVKDLLTMSSGHEKEPTLEMVKHDNWAKVFLSQPITHRPGSTFMYNSGATYMLSAIVQHQTGERLADYLKPRLFEPLGIKGPAWEICPRGINTGGWGLSVRTEDLAKFGQLYLQRGVWDVRQLLPSRWIEEATTFKIQQPRPAQPSRPNEQNDWLQGYCYQFWRCRHRAFRGDGAFGQYLVVMPERDAVVAITAESPNLQGELDLVWDYLLPAMKDKPLLADSRVEAELRQKLASLTLRPPKTQPCSPVAGRISGQAFALAPNELCFESASFRFGKQGCTFTLRDGRCEHSIVCGLEAWKHGETALPGTPPRLISGGAPLNGTKFKVAASGTWKEPDMFEMMLRYYQTPHHDLVRCRFEGDKVEISFLNSIARMMGATRDQRPVLRGQMIPGRNHA